MALSARPPNSRRSPTPWTAGATRRKRAELPNVETALITIHDQLVLRDALRDFNVSVMVSLHLANMVSTTTKDDSNDTDDLAEDEGNESDDGKPNNQSDNGEPGNPTKKKKRGLDRAKREVVDAAYRLSALQPTAFVDLLAPK